MNWTEQLKLRVTLNVPSGQELKDSNGLKMLLRETNTVLLAAIKHLLELWQKKVSYKYYSCQSIQKRVAKNHAYLVRESHKR